MLLMKVEVLADKLPGFFSLELTVGDIPGLLPPCCAYRDQIPWSIINRNQRAMLLSSGNSDVFNTISKKQRG